MCDKAVNRCFLTFTYIPDRYETREMWDRTIPKDYFMLVYCPDEHKTQKTSDGAVDVCLVVLKLIPDWFFTSKMLEKLDNALHTDDNILFYNEVFDKVTFI